MSDECKHEDFSAADANQIEAICRQCGKSQSDCFAEEITRLNKQIEQLKSENERLVNYKMSQIVDIEKQISHLKAENERLKEKLEGEIKRLAEYKSDIENATKFALDEKCTVDEKHCACVPLLRAEIKRLNEDSSFINDSLNSLVWLTVLVATYRKEIKLPQGEFKEFSKTIHDQSVKLLHENSKLLKDKYNIDIYQDPFC